MELHTPDHSYRGQLVHTPWSIKVAIVEVLISVKIATRTFHGVRAVNTDRESWDWLDVENLLWVYDTGCGLHLWQQIKQRPFVFDESRKYKIEGIVGEYQSAAGNAYVGVKWRGYECPTWELEDDLSTREDLDYLAVAS